jgi:predicted phosphodiesterase
MRIATFGDLHLTHRPLLDKHGGDETALLRFDDHLSRNHDRIILMGDIYQTDYGPSPGSCAEVLGAILDRYKGVFQRWCGATYTMLFGNHDRVAQTIMGASNQIHMLQDGLRMWFIHGHQFDPFIDRHSRMPYVITWIIGGLRRIGWHRMADYLEGPFYRLGQKHFPHLDPKTRQALATGRIDLVAMGHSHKMACRSIGKGVYLNAGACSTDRMHYLSIDTLTRIAQVRMFEPPNHHAVVMHAALAA